MDVVLLRNILWLKLGRFSKKSDELLIFKPGIRARIFVALQVNQCLNSLCEELKQK